MRPVLIPAFYSALSRNATTTDPSLVFERVRAIVQYRIAQVELYLAEGTVLERRGILLSLPFAGKR